MGVAAYGIKSQSQHTPHKAEWVGTTDLGDLPRPLKLREWQGLGGGRKGALQN